MVVRFTMPVGWSIAGWRRTPPVGPLPIGDLSTNEISSPPAPLKIQRKNSEGAHLSLAIAAIRTGVRRAPRNKMTLRSRLSPLSKIGPLLTNLRVVLVTSLAEYGCLYLLKTPPQGATLACGAHAVLG
jgi:hypothetical protein